MQLYANSALLVDGWADDVLIDIDDGRFSGFAADVRAIPEGAERLGGPVIPGMANVHSHAFQRGFAGLSERRGPGEDSFWTWREVMYAFLSSLSPEQMQAVAEQLYVEMLKTGYTCVGEFHYVHHGLDGTPYATLTETSDRIIEAASTSGIAITHLPVLYAHGGFGGVAPTQRQARFINDTDRYGRLLETLLGRYAGQANIRIGAAPHSLRAADVSMISSAVDVLSRDDPRAPVHIHIAEQRKEVEECVAVHGARPVDWLCGHLDVDARWCLVHATHLSDDELTRIADSTAVVGLCPTTEANLGDGIFPALELARGGGRFGVGSDSNVSVSPVEELRLLEYGQRLVKQRRALLASPARRSVGAFLYEHAAKSGAQALGRESGSLELGKNADLVVIDDRLPTLVHKREDLLLDAMLFAGNSNPVRDVMVGGEWCVRDGHHPDEQRILDRYKKTLGEIMSSHAL